MTMSDGKALRALVEVLEAAEELVQERANPAPDYMFRAALHKRLEAKADVARLALSAADSLLSASSCEAGWRDIDSAPRDGTVFLAYEKGAFFNCWWYDNGYGEAYWMDEADSEPNPTHWMPLPAPPSPGDLTSPHPMERGDG